MTENGEYGIYELEQQESSAVPFPAVATEEPKPERKREDGIDYYPVHSALDPEESRKTWTSLPVTPGAVPHSFPFSRTALFGAGRRGDKLRQTTLAAASGCSITATGSSLDVFDRKVYDAVLSISRTTGSFEFSCHVGRIAAAAYGGHGSQQNKAVLASLHRLATCIIDLDFIFGKRVKLKHMRRWTECREYKFCGALISEYRVSQQTTKSPNNKQGGTRILVRVRLNPELSNLFSPGTYACDNQAVIKALGRDGLAIWLYSFLNSFSVPAPAIAISNNIFAYSFERLRRLSNSGLSLRKFKVSFTKSVQKLQAAIDAHPDCNRTLKAFLNNENKWRFAMAIPRDPVIEKQIELTTEARNLELAREIGRNKLLIKTADKPALCEMIGRVIASMQEEPLRQTMELLMGYKEPKVIEHPKNEV